MYSGRAKEHRGNNRRRGRWAGAKEKITVTHYQNDRAQDLQAGAQHRREARAARQATAGTLRMSLLTFWRQVRVG
ncbi:hypothetical protein SAMN00790413_00842 [Deinococcus hopiensis KR-140]|uniref:Uncharacterized protein n=1 Tax=Deinococcus hopiensis KR-140 TaxID=695939 RepID=A0A1W1VAZ0_9DEIO|nr:hypothetical protein SAMN00790413_00842 [Deinococcus hopiensis KR-140]